MIISEIRSLKSNRDGVNRGYYAIRNYLSILDLQALFSERGYLKTRTYQMFILFIILSNHNYRKLVINSFFLL